MKEKKHIRYKLLLEGLLALLIALTPIIFYAYNYVPAGTQEFFTLTPNGFPDVPTALHAYFSTLIPMLLLLAWFISCKHWWYPVLLIPLSMYSFQVYNVFRHGADNTDENEILYIAAIATVVVPIVYFIRVKLVDKYIHGIDLKALNNEIELLKEIQELRKEREKLEEDQKNLSKKM